MTELVLQQSSCSERCLSQGSSEAEPVMEIPVQVIYLGYTLRRKGMTEA